MSKLLTPGMLGRHALSHRIVLAPITRLRTSSPATSPAR